MRDANIHAVPNEAALPFNPGSPAGYRVLGGLVMACNHAIQFDESNEERILKVLPGFQDADAVIKRMPDLALRLIDYGDHPQQDFPIRDNKDCQISAAAVCAVASGYIPVTRDSEMQLVKTWIDELTTERRGRGHSGFRHFEFGLVNKVRERTSRRRAKHIDDTTLAA